MSYHSGIDSILKASTSSPTNAKLSTWSPVFHFDGPITGPALKAAGNVGEDIGGYYVGKRLDKKVTVVRSCADLPRRPEFR